MLPATMLPATMLPAMMLLNSSRREKAGRLEFVAQKESYSGKLTASLHLRAKE
jgi:hypothetical protein